MSGLLRRIKRSRPADAGEPLPEGQAAAPEGAAPATDPATGFTQPLPGDVPGAELPAPAEKPATEKPVLLADPGTPAGVDPATAAMRPPAGRRGRLRRRLRYLRRARELMLRDLGGLLYEIHRTAGGDVESHGNIVRAKVQRIAGLDAEAHAIETALASPRTEAVVFQPGVGGTCPTCGELYGSAAHYCANCGTPFGAAAHPAPAVDPSPTPAPATRESVFGRPAPPSQALASGDPLRSPADAAGTGADAVIVPAETHAGREATAGEAAADERATGDDTIVTAPSDETASEPAPDASVAAGEPAAADEAGADTSATDERATATDATTTEIGDEAALTGADPGAPDDDVTATTGDVGATGEDVGPTGADDTATGEDATVTGEDATATGEDATATGDDATATGDDATVTGQDTTEIREGVTAADDEPAATAEDAAAGESAAAGDDGAADREDPAAGGAASGDEPKDAGGNPFSGLRNGRAEDHTPPELSSGDPLVSREGRS